MSTHQMLMQLVANLPQVLQDLIGEYNAEHRSSMKPVLDELIHKHHLAGHIRIARDLFQELELTIEPYDMITCDCCTNYIRQLNDDYVLDYYDYRYYYCSYFCLEDALYAMRKRRSRMLHAI